MISRRRWLAGCGLMAATYLTLGAINAAGDDPGSALVYLVAATVTFGFAAAVLPVIVPHRRDDGDDGPGGGGGGPEGGGPGGNEPPPPWWPEFERQFWVQLGGHGDRAEHAGSRFGDPDGPRPRERTPA